VVYGNTFESRCSDVAASQKKRRQKDLKNSQTEDDIPLNDDTLPRRTDDVLLDGTKEGSFVRFCDPPEGTHRPSLEICKDRILI